MCGIVGYIGHRQATPILMEGLSRLSYRGYDSAGIAAIGTGGTITVRKAKGKLENLEALLNDRPVAGCIGIGHTRWATHGEPSDLNAHPHTDVKGGIAVVHNGIIENHGELRQYLKSKGAEFVSQTDTEVIAHLLNELYDGDMRTTLMQAMRMLEGSYALGILCSREPDTLYCAKNDSPLVAGFQNGEAFLASDIPALLTHTRDVLFLEDREIGMLNRQGIHVWDAYGKSRQQAFFHVDWDLSSAEKGGFAHYMLKEIHEQPEALGRTLAQRTNWKEPEWFPLSEPEVQRLRKITIVACGTAYHAGVFGKYAIEKLARIPVEADVASEYRYREPVVGKDELFIAVSQSGETADTLAAVREAKKSGARVIAVCNVVGSSIVREVGEESTLYTYAGPEIAVASTKAYMTQAEMMVLIAAALARLKGTTSQQRLEKLMSSVEALPEAARQTLQCETQIQRLTSRMSRKKHAFFIGRGMDYALSMEAALKLKEVSYIFSEAYAAGELKHGPLALLQEGRLVVAAVTQPSVADKMLSNLQEVSSRGAYIVAICTNNLTARVKEHAEEVIEVPDTDEYLAPLLAAIPLQMFAYFMAVERGCDVDQPRNLAKSVTVE